MTSDKFDYVIPEKKSITDLINSFQGIFNLRVEPEDVLHRTFYDTFDWRLYNSGSSLETLTDRISQKVYWRTCKDDDLKIQLGLSNVHQFINQFPPSDLRKQLEPIQKVRELIPRVKLKIKRQPVVLLNNENKIVVRLNLDEYWYSPSKMRAGHVLGKRVSIKPVKGYQDHFNKMLDYIQLLELRTAPDNMMKLALAESGQGAGEYTSKLNLFLDPEERSDEAVKEILARLVEILQQNTPGTIKGDDTEYLHDYRVAIRKTRSALSQIKNVLPKDVTDKYSKFFSQLGTLTTPIRDIDVFLIKMTPYQKSLKGEEREKLVELKEYLLDARKKDQDQLIKTLKSESYRDTLRSWKNFLEQAVPEQSAESRGTQAVSDLSNDLIWALYQKSLNQGSSISPDSVPDELHTLRKTCKKLRYLMEFFQSLYPARRMQELLLVLKGLQDVLGDYNDYAVHISMLKKFNKKIEDKKLSKVLYKLIQTLEIKQQKVRNSFSKQFKIFSSQDHINEFREMFVDLK